MGNQHTVYTLSIILAMIVISKAFRMGNFGRQASSHRVLLQLRDSSSGGEIINKNIQKELPKVVNSLEVFTSNLRSDLSLCNGSQRVFHVQTNVVLHNDFKSLHHKGRPRREMCSLQMLEK